jgi:hypothetical protein
MSRDPRDFYETPAWCVTELYRALPYLPKPTLDPCAGNGALLAAAPSDPSNRIRGIELDPELVAAAPSHLRINVGDGLALGWRGQHMLLNPPYRDAETWVRKGIEEARSMVVLLRLGFLASQGRAPLFKAYPPRALVVLSQRPSFTGKGTDNSDYAWMFWTRDTRYQTRRGMVTMSWIDKPTDQPPEG